MTTETLLKKFEAYYGKEYTDEARAAFLGKVARFSDQERQRLYSSVIEICKKLPLIAEIYQQAQSLGFFDSKEQVVHSWKPSACKLCAGEGRITTVWLGYFDEKTQRRMERLEHIMPYSSEEAIRYPLKPGEYVRLARCKCEAGAADTIAPNLGRWSDQVQPVRFV